MKAKLTVQSVIGIKFKTDYSFLAQVALYYCQWHTSAIKRNTKTRKQTGKLYITCLLAYNFYVKFTFYEKIRNIYKILEDRCALF